MAQVDSFNNPNDPENPDEEANKAQQQQGEDSNPPATTGGAGAVTTTGSGNVTGKVVGTNNPSQPFQNISAYLSANEPQSKQLAGQVASTVSNPINEASQGITKAATDFTGSVNAGYTPRDSGLISAVGTNAAGVAADPNNVANFQKQLNNRYTGPTEFTQQPGYGDLEAKIANAQGQANNTQSEGGIQTLLKSVEGPTTAGINKLDSLLLSANPENYKTVQDSGKGAADLLPTLNTTRSAQNALAAQGAGTASQTSADAAAALQAALTGEKGSLSQQQKTIQGIVDQYNKSVNIIDPVTQNVNAAISEFLRNNPNLKPADAAAALAPLMGLKPIDAPEMSTYASGADYDTVAALQALGLSPEDLAGIGINPSTKDLAQTFKVPTQLQDAVGKAPGVEKALQDLLSGLGGQITGAYQPYQDLMGREMTRADLKTQLDALARPSNNATPEDQAAYQAAQQAIYDKAAAAGIPGGDINGSYWPQIAQMAQGLQWLDPASTGYNALIEQINAELGKLGEVGVPTLNYNPSAPTKAYAPEPGQLVAKDIGKTADLAAAGATGASAVGSGVLAGTEFAGAPLATGFSAGDSALIGVQGGLQTLGPAALAAYGTSNIAQNAAKRPLESGLATLANTGLSLATLSIPPKYFESIRDSISSVLNSIGDFFGGLF